MKDFKRFGEISPDFIKMIRILKISSGFQGFPGFPKDLVDLCDFQKISRFDFGFLSKVYEISARDTPIGASYIAPTRNKAF